MLSLFWYQYGFIKYDQESESILSGWDLIISWDHNDDDQISISTFCEIFPALLTYENCLKPYW